MCTFGEEFKHLTEMVFTRAALVETSIKKNVTINLVTHNIGQAEQISDYTALLYQCELIKSGLAENYLQPRKTNEQKNTWMENFDRRIKYV